MKLRQTGTRLVAIPPVQHDVHVVKYCFLSAVRGWWDGLEPGWAGWARWVWSKLCISSGSSGREFVPSLA